VAVVLFPAAVSAPACMRVISFLFTSALILAIIGIGGGLLAREFLLTLGASSVRSALTVLHRLSRDNLQYARQCRERGGVTADVATIGGVQLRFVDSRNYVIEVICSQFQSEPIVVEKYTLPLFVKKTPGSSGIIWGTDRSAIQLEVFGRKQIVGVENEEIKSYAGDSISLGLSPISTCSGYGYQCCQQETTAGVGQPFSGVNDCPKTCYSVCQPRPIVLSLNTDPFVDEITRTTTAAPGEAVTFNYVASYEENQPVTVTLDFGDGQQQTFTTLSGKASHQYGCPNGGCTYAVRLSVRAQNGVEAALTPIMQLKVAISP